MYIYVYIASLLFSHHLLIMKYKTKKVYHTSKKPVHESAANMLLWGLEMLGLIMCVLGILLIHTLFYVWDMLNLRRVLHQQSKCVWWTLVENFLTSCYFCRNLEWMPWRPWSYCRYLLSIVPSKKKKKKICTQTPTARNSEPLPPLLRHVFSISFVYFSTETVSDSLKIILNFH